MEQILVKDKDTETIKENKTVIDEFLNILEGPNNTLKPAEIKLINESFDRLEKNKKVLEAKFRYNKLKN